MLKLNNLILNIVLNLLNYINASFILAFFVIERKSPGISNLGGKL